MFNCPTWPQNLASSIAPQFLNALSMCADKKGCTFEDVVRAVLVTGGPIAHATTPENVRLHDDKVYPTRWSTPWGRA